jgi:hypothetical protein
MNCSEAMQITASKEDSGNGISSARAATVRMRSGAQFNVSREGTDHAISPLPEPALPLSSARSS